MESDELSQVSLIMAAQTLSHKHWKTVIKTFEVVRPSPPGRSSVWRRGSNKLCNRSCFLECQISCT